MSPTDEIKIQMKYQEDDAKHLHLQSPQPELIDFKRSKVKAIRVLYQNRLHFNSNQSSVTDQVERRKKSRKFLFSIYLLLINCRIQL